MMAVRFLPNMKIEDYGIDHIIVVLKSPLFQDIESFSVKNSSEIVAKAKEEKGWASIKIFLGKSSAKFQAEYIVVPTFEARDDGESVFKGFYESSTLMGKKFFKGSLEETVDFAFRAAYLDIGR